MIYGERVKEVRELLGWTQAELAKKHGVTQPFIAQVENGWKNAPDEFMRAFSFSTGFPLTFFEAVPELELPLGSLLFRSRADMTEREQRALRTHASMAHEVLHRMLAGRSIRESQVRIPHVAADPEAAAEIARSELGLSPDGPVKNVIHAMESAGVLVIGLPRAFVGGDAFCVWALTPTGHRRPIVVMSSDRPADRVRMSASHELGHLVMHQPLPSSPDIHEQADRFAGAFLMPAESIKQAVGTVTTLETFLEIKLKWGVSAQAAIVRAHHLGLITPRKYRTLFQLLSARGWRKHEPLSSQIPMERPRAFRQIAEMIYGSRLNYDKIAQDIRYPEPFLRELFDAHAKRDSAPIREAQKLAKERGDVLSFPRKT